MNTSAQPLDKILEAYRISDANGRKVLELTFGSETFSSLKPLSLDSITSFSDICKLSGTTEKDFKALYGSLPVDEYAYRQLKLLTSVLNAGWTPNYSDSNEPKYYPYFKWNGSGFGFAGTYYDCADTATSCGSRLCFKERKTAEFAGKTFIDIYNAYLK